MTAAILSSPAREKTASSPLFSVLVVTHYYGSHGGGVERVADRLIREISKTGFCHFTWAAGACDSPQDQGAFLPLPMPTLNLLEKFMGLPWPMFSPLSLWRLYKAVCRADAVWLHDTLYPGNIAAFWMARARNVPVVITQHLAPIPYRNKLLRWTMALADVLVTLPMLRRAHEVTFISDRVAEDYYARVIFARAIKIIPNGVDTRFFYAPIPENRRFLREQFALRQDQPVLLFVGRFVERKGLAVLRKLAERLPSCRFWLAGDGPIKPEYWLLPNVHVFRGRREESLAALYQAADLFVLPSYGEGFPLVIQEAMACGLPVLCGPETAQGCLPAKDLLQTADVFPDDPERTAQAWDKKIRAFPVPLPLIHTLDALSDFAQRLWEWPPIAGVYADIFAALRRDA